MYGCSLAVRVLQARIIVMEKHQNFVPAGYPKGQSVIYEESASVQRLGQVTRPCQKKKDKLYRRFLTIETSLGASVSAMGKWDSAGQF